VFYLYRCETENLINYNLSAYLEDLCKETTDVYKKVQQSIEITSKIR
jgi:hypothetical protein